MPHIAIELVERVVWVCAKSHGHRLDWFRLYKLQGVSTVTRLVLLGYIGDVASVFPWVVTRSVMCWDQEKIHGLIMLSWDVEIDIYKEL